MTDRMGDLPKPGSARLDITDGTRLIVRTAAGERLHMIATGRPVRGRDFPVVWVCSALDYGSPARSERLVPWPLDEVEVESDDRPEE